LNEKCSDKKLKLLSEFYSNMFLAAMGQFHVTEWTKCENDSNKRFEIWTELECTRLQSTSTVV